MLTGKIALEQANLWTAEGAPDLQIALLKAELKACQDLLQLTINHGRRKDAVISAVQKENHDLKSERHTDPLTGLLNARFLLEEAPVKFSDIQSKRSPDSRLMVVYCDINGLKTVNDTYGHEVGDTLLKIFGEALRKKFKRQDDQFIIRKCGDEFVLILQNSTPAYVESALNEVNEQTSFKVNDMTIDVKCGYGYSVYAGQDLNTMLAEADHALYANKKSRKAEGFTTTIQKTAS